jgi:WhiB family transcriptional regulator, redox-sensing transcriptional regulator
VTSDLRPNAAAARRTVPTTEASSGDWRSAAACLSADPELFFPISSAGPSLGQVARVKAICAECQVRRKCLEYALAEKQIHGVWGGTTEDERVLLRGATPAGRRPAP